MDITSTWMNLHPGYNYQEDCDHRSINSTAEGLYSVKPHRKTYQIVQLSTPKRLKLPEGHGTGGSFGKGQLKPGGHEMQ